MFGHEVDGPHDEFQRGGLGGHGAGDDVEPPRDVGLVAPLLVGEFGRFDEDGHLVRQGAGLLFVCRDDLHEVAQAVFEQADERGAFLDDEAAHHATARLPAMTPTALSLG